MRHVWAVACAACRVWFESGGAAYGVATASEPRPKISACWMSEPPDLPSGLPITSIAACGTGWGWHGGEV